MIYALREYGALFIVPLMGSLAIGMLALSAKRAVFGDKGAAVRMLVGAYRMLIAMFICGYIAGMWH